MPIPTKAAPGTEREVLWPLAFESVSDCWFSEHANTWWCLVRVESYCVDCSRVVSRLVMVVLPEVLPSARDGFDYNCLAVRIRNKKKHIGLLSCSRSTPGTSYIGHPFPPQVVGRSAELVRNVGVHITAVRQVVEPHQCNSTGALNYVYQKTPTEGKKTDIVSNTSAHFSSPFVLWGMDITALHYTLNQQG